MITAYNDEDNYNRAMQYGADEYITKPLDFEKLKKRVLAL
jgi:DNA-binding response OmpR family regulator